MEKFTKSSDWMALDSKVIVVATTRVDGWAAYVGAVDGVNHSIEWMSVLRNGTKLNETLARVLFGSNDPRFGSFVDYCP